MFDLFARETDILLLLVAIAEAFFTLALGFIAFVAHVLDDFFLQPTAQRAVQLAKEKSRT